jgi:hypothetical protein
MDGRVVRDELGVLHVGQVPPADLASPRRDAHSVDRSIDRKPDSGPPADIDRWLGLAG